MQKRIVKIAVTGGPCAGKTSAMEYLKKELSSLGYGVIIVPELATEIINAGLKPRKNIPTHIFQSYLVELGITKEDIYEQLAKHTRDSVVVILYDRGIVDSEAYTPKTVWQTVLKDLKQTRVLLRDDRYDAVIFLRSLAFDYEQGYEKHKHNNPARFETLQEAKQKDIATLNAWTGHPHLYIINNAGSFEEKLQKTRDTTLHILGDPLPLEIEHKYLVDPSFTKHHIPTYYEEVEIEQFYVPMVGRLRKRGRGYSYTYTKTIKKDTSDPLVRVEEEEKITKEEYEQVKKKWAITPIRKKRLCFVYNDTHMELDFFKHAPLIFLEVELLNATHPVSLPPWIPVLKNITNDKNYTNFAIAKGIQ